jgi:hypothetical protein
MHLTEKPNPRAWKSAMGGALLALKTERKKKTKSEKW